MKNSEHGRFAKRSDEIAKNDPQNDPCPPQKLETAAGNGEITKAVSGGLISVLDQPPDQWHRPKRSITRRFGREFEVRLSAAADWRPVSSSPRDLSQRAPSFA